MLYFYVDRRCNAKFKKYFFKNQLSRTNLVIQDNFSLSFESSVIHQILSVTFNLSACI